MKGLIPQLNTLPPESEEPITQPTGDELGNSLQKKWDRWSMIRRQIEERWLEDLRMYNQENDDDANQLSKFHAHIYLGTGRKNALAAYSRIYDVIKDKHWAIEHTPIPESDAEDPNNQAYMEIMEERAELMSTEIEDQLIDLRYMDKLSTAVLESCILGTGVVKGVIPTTRKDTRWAFSDGAWDVVTTETPWMDLTTSSVFNTYPDPYATCQEEISGVFERHVLTRTQFSELKSDSRFDVAKINEILSQTDSGNHTPLWHETQRRNLGKITDTTAAGAGRYDLLEYWGEVSGHMLSISGVENVTDDETYMANVWVCAGRTLLAKVMPMKKQRIPYHFFRYAVVPHQFWGIGPVRMGRSSALMENGVYRAMLDGLAFTAMPMAEINVNMLKDGESPNIIPGKQFLRDSGDPATPAVRFFQPDIPTGNLLQVGETVRTLNQEETSLPAYSYGAESQSINDQTATGTSMRLNMASLPMKLVIKNLEDGIIKPVIESIYDWNMEWSDKEEIKGDMHVNVLGANSIMMKEQRSQALMTALNVTANPLDAPKIDRKYLLRELFKVLEIDDEKAVPDQMPPENQPQPDPLNEAKVALTQAQAAKMQAETVNKKVESEFSAMAAAEKIALLPGLVPIGDGLLQSAGFEDANGTPITQSPAQAMQRPTNYTEQRRYNFNENTSPMFPPNPDVGVNQGIETGAI